MNHYTIHYNTNQPESRFVKIEVSFPAETKETMVLRLPAWRPGRYELGNFAKNVKDFSVVDEDGKNLTFAKRTKDEWLVHCHEAKTVKVTYWYYAADLNAGSTFMDQNQLYVNPVNCLIYEENREDEPSVLKLEIPTDFEVAVGLDKIDQNIYRAASFHELADSPLMASPHLQHRDYVVGGVHFHIWFNGEVKPEWGRLIKDFTKFSEFQIKKFGGFPVDEYHFLIQIDTKQAYHGVEHQRSTVIYLGPSYLVFEKLYTELLGVCSHELYHTWNVKAIRPQEMFPYDYSRENYSRLGYVAEGVTTYMGDRVLFECGVFDNEQYNKELANYFTRHYHNDGRKHLSVADSSFDTWLDGYVQGVPGRKTSIYVEGCLIAYICDMRIRKETNGKKFLHDAMQMLYNLSRGMGYSDSVYQEVLEAVGGVSFEDIFDDLVFGTHDFTGYLEEALSIDGRMLHVQESLDTCHHFGVKGGYIAEGFKVSAVLEGSAGDQTGLIPGDVVHGINGIIIENNLAEWLKYFAEDKIALQIKRNGMLRKETLSSPSEVQYFVYRLTEKE